MSQLSSQPDYSQIDVLVVGAGPAGLAAAITTKHARPDLSVCVIDKAERAGNHNMSGAMLEERAVAALLDPILPDWRESREAKAALGNRVVQDDIYFFLGKKWRINLSFLFRLGKRLKLSLGQMVHDGDYICSSSRLSAWLAEIAVKMGVEVMYGFSAEEVIWDEAVGKATGVKLMDQGVDREGQPQVNYQTGEVIQAQTIILAEGCDGLLAEKFIQQAGLKRETHQLYSLGLKMLFRVDPERYRQFGEQRAVHTIGWPLWRPIVGPSLFGGGFIYPAGENQLAVGIITGLDYPFCDFNPQDALARFWQHAFVSPFLEGAVRVEAGARLIPEGGYYALPRAPDTGSIGRANVLLVGDSAGLVSMLKIKGLHNALLSGMAAGTAAAHEDVVSAHDSEAVTAHDGEAATARDGEAITAHDGATPALDGATPAHDGATPAHDGAHAAHVSGERETTATRYTHLLEESGVLDELRQSKDFRQVVARFGPLIGKPLSVFARFLPRFKIEPDYATLTTRHYPLGMEGRFDKADFVALAGTSHREEQRCHLLIQDSDICMRLCLPKYGAPCITFCPAGVYEGIQGTPKAANPSNCLHCKTCQRKCPFDNIRWTVPEGTGGTRYKNL